MWENSDPDPHFPWDKATLSKCIPRESDPLSLGKGEALWSIDPQAKSSRVWSHLRNSKL